MARWRDKEIINKVKNRIIKDKLVLVGEYVAGQAKLLTPVDTGRLRGSITYATAKKRSNVTGAAQGKDRVSKPDNELSVRIGTAVEYAAKIEFTSKSFLRTAFKSSKAAIKQIMSS